jgi:hypothetical protein
VLISLGVQERNLSTHVRTYVLRTTLGGREREKERIIEKKMRSESHGSVKVYFVGRKSIAFKSG